ncbi:MAG: phospho-N-acetylmuramoyl-pentapeptide-transferase [Bdellovibrionales bacterium]|nr:phospho-N-acetylmuramoyl-pentapeptide-transferase [Bdellovibrionales bacterium]
MIYHLLYPLHVTYGALRVFRYISFRLFLAILTALFINFLFGPWVIRKLKEMQMGSDNIREDVPKTHQVKTGTPTMGGILIAISLMLSFLLWARWDEKLTWIITFSTLSFGLIGFFDDYNKVRRRKGILAKSKIQLQVGASLIVCAALVYFNFDTTLQIPFFKELSFRMPIWMFLVFGSLVIVGASNAVNLTDGLDGLAIGPALVTAMTYMLFAYIAGHEKFADYLQIVKVNGAGELAIFCGALLGAGLGFLWFNTYPAQVFMGDVGSLALGAAIGTVAIMVKQELLLIVVGGVFVLETLSVMIQVISFKTTGKRVFRMAPLHHHFELKGWMEPKVIVRFWIISIILAILALTTLKLR